MNESTDHPVTITSARISRSDDLRRRQRRYLLSMGIRTVCFVLAVVTTGPLRWSFVFAAVFLPYIAVVLANATDTRSALAPASFHTQERPALESGREGPTSETGQ